MGKGKTSVAAEVPHNADAIEKAVTQLNSMLEADPVAITLMFNHEEYCNEKLAKHPTCQVADTYAFNDGTKRSGGDYFVRPLGIINGLFGVDKESWGWIYMEWDSSNKVIEKFGVRF